MGEGYKISCNECDYTKEFLIGIGLMYTPYAINELNSERSLLSSLLRSKKLQVVRKLINDKKGEFVSYGHDIYHCSRCGEFYDKFFFHIDHDDGSYEPLYKCTKCKKKLGLFERPMPEPEAVLSSYPCPKCRKNSLMMGYDWILWD